MTHLATETSSNRSPPVARPAAPNSQPGTTLRLPDLSGERKTLRIDSRTADATKSASVVTAVAPDAEITASAARWDFSRERIVAKLTGIVRQPKFWLACVVFVAVQIMLAVIVPPHDDAEEPPVRVEVTTTPEPVSVPAARIVVPAAPTSNEVIEPAPTTGVTTPMGAALPPEPADVTATGDSRAMDEAALPTSATRMADSRGFGDGAQFDGRSVADSDGATLGGIMPLAPTLETTPANR